MHIDKQKGRGGEGGKGEEERHTDSDASIQIRFLPRGGRGGGRSRSSLQRKLPLFPATHLNPPRGGGGGRGGGQKSRSTFKTFLSHLLRCLKWGGGGEEGVDHVIRMNLLLWEGGVERGKTLRVKLGVYPTTRGGEEIKKKGGEEKRE